MHPPLRLCRALTLIALLCPPAIAALSPEKSLSAQKALLEPHDPESFAIFPPDNSHDAHWPINPLEELHGALETMQSHYFELWLGQWPSAIDWTAAVIGTFVSATLHSLTRSLEYVLPGAEHPAVEGQRIENEISKYFSQSVAYYFGEDAFSIRMQAYDDMLWVVLGWLESIKFINLHANRHFKRSGPARAWYGKQFAPAFAHRAHIFYDIASAGWDSKLCGGGMTWNPRLTPYKNAITNQLFISASIDMYLYFPGDENDSPFMQTMGDGGDGGLPSVRPHDRQFLAAAVDGYAWLRGSNMTNAQGLYVDGFHIHNWGKNGSIGTGNCDERNEMTYTYNQGVLLSGLRGLWEGTGSQWYLEDGHELVRAVIAATGWTASESERKKREWHGMGRAGVLEEACDAAATCSQNGQTFKGIFFHHLTLFCAPLPLTPVVPGVTHGASRATAQLHRQSCKEYATWVAHNARMALRTRDDEGRFGMWWGAPVSGVDAEEEVEASPLPLGAVDYRNNESLPEGRMWMPLSEYEWSTEEEDGPPSFMGFDPVAGSLGGAGGRSKRGESRAEIRDKNDRGRGRTVETQAGGVAVVRALWEFVNMYRE